MRAVVQRVKKGSVEIKEKQIGKIEKGLVVLLGVGQKDVEKDAEYLAVRERYKWPDFSYISIYFIWGL